MSNSQRVYHKVIKPLKRVLGIALGYHSSHSTCGKGGILRIWYNRRKVYQYGTDEGLSRPNPKSD